MPVDQITGITADEAFGSLLAAIQDDGVPSHELEELVRRYKAQAAVDEDFRKGLGLRITLAHELPFAVLKAIDRVLQPPPSDSRERTHRQR